MGVSLFLFFSYLSLSPSLFIEALLFVLELGLNFTQEASDNLKSPLPVLDCLSACCKHMQHVFLHKLARLRD